MSAKTKPAPVAAKRGRPVELTAEERAEKAKARNHRYQTSEEYKERRKQRYEADPEYRAACLEQSRRAFEAKQAPQRAAYAKAVRRRVMGSTKIGQARRIRPVGGRNSRIDQSYTIPEMSEVICRSPVIVRGWINAGRFPEPNHETVDGRLRVFTNKQMLALADAAIHHLRTASAHLTLHNEEAIVALHRAVA